ncbi:trans-cinnamate 4-monooxygenase-like [Phoenix dactylifera]|uniref:trans-cinnamate 4-monooxygenase n=1 Tax=Phoenix dactylifera TaxID=42345 RepID=A0A8B9B2A0_PHODC|nr:trans-cinnamate 4-monooxygenase-like [Phoenix dactylifera]
MDLVLLEKALLGLFAAVTLAIAASKLPGKRFGDDLNHRNRTALAKRFGDIFVLRMGQWNLVVVSSLEMARDVLHTQGVEFGSRTCNVVFDIFTGKGQDMVFTIYGEHWRKVCRIMTVPFFTNKVVQQNRHGWEEEARRVVEDVKAIPNAATELGGHFWRRRWWG